MGAVKVLAAAVSCAAAAAMVYGCCWVHVRLMPEPVYDWPRWWYLLWIVWVPRAVGRPRAALTGNGSGASGAS